jgi:hypothetical protein
MPRGNKSSFNPKSPDAMFATIIERLNQQDEMKERMHKENKEVLDEIRDEVKKTNGRVTKLENWRDYQKGKIAGIALAVSSAVAVIGWVVHLVFGGK